ncbi:MAG: hypothetical protein U0610_05885 [bacterium]
MSERAGGPRAPSAAGVPLLAVLGALGALGLASAPSVRAATSEASSSFEPIRAERYFEPVEIAPVGAGERVFAFQGDAWIAVPQQRLPGAVPTAVVLAESIGGEAPAARAAGLRAVRVRDPLDEARGFFYVGTAPDAVGSDASADFAPTLYARESRRITARCYDIAFEAHDPALFATLAVMPRCGGNGRNVFAGLESASQARLIAIGVDVETNRDDLVSELLDLEGGPIVVLREIGYRVRLPFGRTTAESTQQARFYPYHYTFPVRLELPAIVDYVVSRLTIELSGWWRADAAPFRVLTGAGGRAVLDGRGGDAPLPLDGEPFTGWRVSSDAATIANVLVLDPAAPFEARLRCGDQRVERAGVPAVGPLGFVLRSTGGVSGRAWRATSVTIFPRPGDERGPEEFTRLVAHPLEVAPGPRADE